MLDVVRGVESKTGHGSWGSGRFEEKREGITELTAELGRAGNTVGNTVKHLGIVQDVLDHLEGMKEGMRVDGVDLNERVRASDESLLRAVGILGRQCGSLREQCGYLEARIRNQSSVVSTGRDFRDESGVLTWALVVRVPYSRRFENQH